MIKKFFVAMIVGLLFMSAQIAAAEDYDWSKAPRIGTKAELADYIENGRRKGQTTFHVIFTNELKTSKEEFENGELDAEKFINIALVLHVASNGTHFTDGTSQMTYTITEYPGTRVANAYLAHLNWDDRAFNNLEPKEKRLFHIAVGIVNEANKRNSEIEKARYIHDEICRRVLEYKDENERNKTAIGALIDGYTHCQGFTDTFYMLGRMSGLNVGRINGTMKGDSHAWNWITFSNGKSYCVDVTNGFNTKTQYLFCASKERIEKAGWWCLWEIIPNLQ